MPSTTLATLTVSREPLKVAAQRMAKILGRPRCFKVELAVRCVGEDGLLQTPGAEELLPASGNWPGAMRVSGSTLLILAKSMPEGDPLTFWVEDQTLCIRGTGSTFRVKGQWEDLSPPHVDVALDASDSDILRVYHANAPAVLISAGLKRRIEQAERRFQKGVDVAHQAVLRFGIPRAELEATLRHLITKPKA